MADGATTGSANPALASPGREGRFLHDANCNYPIPSRRQNSAIDSPLASHRSTIIPRSAHTDSRFAPMTALLSKMEKRQSSSTRGPSQHGRVGTDTDLLRRLPSHPINRLEELLPDNWKINNPA